MKKVTLKKTMMLLAFLFAFTFCNNIAYSQQCTPYGLTVQTQTVGNTIIAQLVITENFTNTDLASSLSMGLNFAGNTTLPTVNSCLGPSGAFNVTPNTAIINLLSFSNPINLNSTFGIGSVCDDAAIGNNTVIATFTFNEPAGTCINFTIPANVGYVLDVPAQPFCPPTTIVNDMQCNDDPPATCPSYGLSIQTQTIGNTIIANLIMNQSFTTQDLASNMTFGINYSGNTSIPTVSTCLGPQPFSVNTNSAIFTSTSAPISLINTFNTTCTGNIIATFEFDESDGDCINFTINPSSGYQDFTTGQNCNPFYATNPVPGCISTTDPDPDDDTNCPPYSLDINTYVNATGDSIIAELVINENFTLQDLANGLTFGITYAGNTGLPDITSCLGSTMAFAPTMNQAVVNITTFSTPFNLFNTFNVACPTNVIATFAFAAEPGDCIDFLVHPNSSIQLNPTNDICAPFFSTEAVEECLPIIVGTNCEPFDLSIQTYTTGTTIVAELVVNHGFLPGDIATDLEFNIDYTGNSSTPTVTDCLTQANYFPSSNSLEISNTVPSGFDLNNFFNSSTCGSTIAILEFDADPGECIDFSININSHYNVPKQKTPCTATILTPPFDECLDTSPPLGCALYYIDIETQTVGNIIILDLVISENFTSQQASLLNFIIDYTGNSSVPTVSSCLPVQPSSSSSTILSLNSSFGAPIGLNSLFSTTCTGNIIATLEFDALPGECINFFIDNDSGYVDFNSGDSCPPLYIDQTEQECLPDPFDCPISSIAVQPQSSNNTIVFDVILNNNFTSSDLASAIDFGFQFTGNSSAPIVSSCLPPGFLNVSPNGVDINASSPFGLSLDALFNDGSCTPGFLTLTFNVQDGECIEFEIDPSSNFTMHDTGDVCYPSKPQFTFEECDDPQEECEEYELNLVYDISGNNIEIGLVVTENFSTQTNISMFDFGILHSSDDAYQPFLGSVCLGFAGQANLTPNTATLSFNSLTPVNLNTLFTPSPCNNQVAIFEFIASPGKCIEFLIDPESSYTIFDTSIECPPTFPTEPLVVCIPASPQSSISGNIKKGYCNRAVPNTEVTIEDLSGNVVCVTETDDNGNYSCNVPAGNYNVYVSEVCEEACSGVSTADRDILIDLAAYAMSFNTYNQVFICDLNENGTLTGADIVPINKVLMGIPTPEIDNWCNFIPTTEVQQVMASTSLSTITPNNLPTYNNNQIVTVTSTTDGIVDFLMYDLGDVDGSCCAPAFPGPVIPFPGPVTPFPPFFNGPVKPLIINGGNNGAPNLPTISGPNIIKPNNLPKQAPKSYFISFPEALNFNHISLEFDISNQAILNEKITLEGVEDIYWEHHIENGKLYVFGTNSDLENEIVIEPNKVVLEINGLLSQPSLGNQSSNYLVDENAYVTRLIESNNPLQTNFIIETYLQKGNNIQLTVNSISNTQATIEILNIFGNVIYQGNEQLYSGENDLTIHANFGNGVHIVRLYNAANSASKTLYLYKR